MDLVQFNKRVPGTIKTNFQVKVLKNKKEFISEDSVIEKLMRYFIKNGLPESD